MNFVCTECGSTHVCPTLGPPSDMLRARVVQLTNALRNAERELTAKHDVHVVLARLRKALRGDE